MPIPKTKLNKAALKAHQVSAYVSAESYDKLVEIAESEEIAVSRVVREAVENFLRYVDKGNQNV